jgi:hypothetical protein
VNGGDGILLANGSKCVMRSLGMNPAVVGDCNEAASFKFRLADGPGHVTRNVGQLQRVDKTPHEEEEEVEGVEEGVEDGEDGPPPMAPQCLNTQGATGPNVAFNDCFNLTDAGIANELFSLRHAAGKRID